ncbi:hypothetical protein I553_5690 [Mycobacterium xenopi 4042]|uniref:Uncharacterized protein n=1 Tax=Mycobacterium xenopi 4042 TaxID=1299334 RepID=X7ZWH0_MYCXE|nr:hypothetical protein I553_5690 [Mycobacterium xenopi 4042]
MQLDTLGGHPAERLARGNPGQGADVGDGAATASSTSAWAAWTATYRSAIRCLSAWKLPIGRPNCTRCLV